MTVEIGYNLYQWHIFLIQQNNIALETKSEDTFYVMAAPIYYCINNYVFVDLEIYVSLQICSLLKSFVSL